MVKGIFPGLLIGVSVFCFSLAYGGSGTVDLYTPLIKYLNEKKYEADKRSLKIEDIAVPPDVQATVNRIGLSHYAVLRNEIFARHGYRFKNEILQEIFSRTKWYKEDPVFNFTQLGKRETQNVDFIKQIEETFDYENIAKWLNNKPYRGDKDLYIERESNFTVPMSVRLSLNHIRLNPSRLLRNEIFARNGYIFKDPKLDKIFSNTRWYQKKSADIFDVTKSMSKVEFLNVDLIKKREWVDIFDSVNITLPKGIYSIPTIEYNALYLKDIVFEDEVFHFSSHLLWPVIQATSKHFDRHKTDVNALVPEKIVDSIKKEKDPLKKLILFFKHKKYEGYVDKIVFNKSDMVPPEYIADAVKEYGVDYKILLRKEIHARKGAIFTDKKTLAVFKPSGWYRPKHYLITNTESRFPSSEKLTEEEITNFSLLEGDELYEKIYGNERYIAVDLKGNTYFVDMAYVDIVNGYQNKDNDGSNGDTMIQLGNGYNSFYEYSNRKPLLEVIKQLIKQHDFDRDENSYEDEGDWGC